jgi:hypothetical protein
MNISFNLSFFVAAAANTAAPKWDMLCPEPDMMF